MAKKLGALILALIFVNLFLLSLVSAINLQVAINPVQKNFISDLNEPAVMEITITNLEENDVFKIYSLVGVEIKADETPIAKGESKKITAYISPNKAVSPKSGPFTFEYKIMNSKKEIATEYMTINIASLKDAISVTTASLNPKSQAEKITVKNNIEYDFKSLEVKVDSTFFTFKETFDLGKFEKKEFDAPLNMEKLKASLAGSYISNINIRNNGASVNAESIINFAEQEDIEESIAKKGILIRRSEITKTNAGNTAKQVEIDAEKNILSYLFTTFNEVPTKVDIKGFKVFYAWQTELAPGEELKVNVTTNWLYPIIIVALIIFIIWLIKQYVEAGLILTKKVSFVRTTGGEFALKVSLKAKSKQHIEKVHIVDRLPHLVELYKKFGAIEPDKVDLKNKRIEWNVASLGKNEERIFSYLIYSKIGVVGKFELPCAKATYQKNGKMKETESNRSFFVNQPKNE